MLDQSKAAAALAELRRRRDEREKPKIVSVPKSIEIDKAKLIATLVAVWSKFSHLSLGQLISSSCKDNLYYMGDESMHSALLSFDPSKPDRCGVTSQSAAFSCTLEKNHKETMHTNHDVGLFWKR